jgi:hypothetical protein
MVVRGSACEAASCTSRSGTPASKLGGGNEGVPQRVRANVLADSGAAGGPGDDAGGAVPVQPPPVGGDEQRSFSALADRQVDRPGGARRERDGDDLAALAVDDHGAVPAFQAQLLDVRASGLRYPQPVQGEQGDQGVLGGRAKPGGDQDRAELVAVQRGRLVVQPGSADVRGRRVLKEFLLDRILIEPGDGAQPPGDCGTGPAFGLQVAGEGLDVGPPNREQGQRADTAPGGELAQVQRGGLSDQAAVPGQEPGQGEPLGLGEWRRGRWRGLWRSSGTSRNG